MKIMLLMMVIFLLGIQPMVVISSLMILVLLYSLLIMYECGVFWFSYMLMLVMLSGVMVVFTYMMSLLPNESFEMSSLVGMLIILLILYMVKGDFFFEDLSLTSLKIWEGITLMSSMYLVVLLLGLMLIVVWISGIQDGAVRVN